MLFRNQLVSFALSEAVLAAAREAVSGTEAADSDETAASEGAQQMASSAAMALAAQAAAERERKHIELMAKKERGRQQQEQKAQQKRQKVSQSQSVKLHACTATLCRYYYIFRWAGYMCVSVVALPLEPESRKPLLTAIESSY